VTEDESNLPEPDVAYIISIFELEKREGMLPGWVETLIEYCQYKASKPGQNTWKIHNECAFFLRRHKANGGAI
jgi:hypothetical protein